MLCLGIGVVCVLTIVFWAHSKWIVPKELTAVPRASPGNGATEWNLEAWTEDGKYFIDVQIDERKYTAEEMEQIFQKGKEWLDKVWLGENERSDRITKDLYFPTIIESLGIYVRWEVEQYQWIQVDGKITEAAFEEEPENVHVQATLSYGKHSYVCDYTVNIMNPAKDSTAEFEALIQSEIKHKAGESLSEETVILPEEIQGRKITWYEQTYVIWPKIFLFGNLIVVLLYFTKEEKKIQNRIDMQTELEQDYPEIVYRMILLIGAGMTVKNAWEKVTSEYERQKEITGRVRCGYEEMAMTIREMNYGIAEIKAYENFGKRCENTNYIRFSELLIQQVKRGAKGMSQLLMQEVTESEIIWRENSRKNAEESGLKLLFPMILLMTDVFALLMIPAFLSMSI